MFSKVVNRASRGIPLSAQVCRTTLMTRAVCPPIVTNVVPTYIQQRNFGKFSDFSKAFKEEYAKAKAEAAAKAGTAAEQGKEEEKKVEESVTSTEEQVQTETVSEESGASEKVKEKLDESKQKMKESMNESKQKMKESMDESKQKMKESMGNATQEAKEQLSKQKEKLSSFWGEFSGEMKKQLNIQANPEKPKNSKNSKNSKKGKGVKKAPVAAVKAEENQSQDENQTQTNATQENPTKPSDTETTTAKPQFESVEDLESVEEEEEEIDPMSDEALGITPEMTEEEADAIRKEAKKKQIKAENYAKKKSRLRETIEKSKERAKVKVRGITWEKVKFFLRDGWNDIKGSNQKPHRVLLDEEEIEKQRQEILQAKAEAEKLKEEHEKDGKPMKTELMNVDNSNDIWAQVADLLKDAPLIEKLLDMSKKVKESKFGETISYASEDMREKWETSQHPLVYKISAVYDELFSESDTAKAIKEVRRTDPTFLEDALRDEMKNSIVPAMLKAWVNADTKTLKLVMSDHAYAQVYSLIKMQQAEGLQMDKHILDIKDVQLQSAHIIERQSPAFLYLVTVQMVNCIRDREGTIVQGKEDEIKQMYYYMALQQEHDEELNIMRWKIAEMQLVGEMDTW